MNQRQFDVLALGNAIVDVVSSVDDDVLVAQSLPKGRMTLVDEIRAASLFSAMETPVQISGGSAANTVVGVASLGGRAVFIGKVKEDAAGRAFRRDIDEAGVRFDSESAPDGPATAQCLVFVTPDGERTMATFLGACQGLTPADVQQDLVAQSTITYLEGYLWDPIEAKAAFRLAADLAHQAGNRVALSLSDPFCVDRYRDEFVQLIEQRRVDVLFANQHELKSLFQTADLDTAIQAAQQTNMLAAITRSEDGCSIVQGDMRQDVSAFPVERVVDATGAGDLFAAGFLHGLCQGAPLEVCARLGGLAASEAISHFGARPEMRLSELARIKGLYSL